MRHSAAQKAMIEKSLNRPRIQLVENNDPVIVVAGLARCGTSMVMQMLSAGGMQCVGRYPAFERSMNVGCQAWIKTCRGVAVKLLDPHRYQLPPGGDYRVIWLDRNVTQQARSTIKMQKELGMRVHKSVRGDMEKLLTQERPHALRALELKGAQILKVRFENLIWDRRFDRTDTVNMIADFVEWDGPMLNRKAMLDAIVDRGAKCLDKVMERDQLAAGRER